jgi:thioredoxin reductase
MARGRAEKGDLHVAQIKVYGASWCPDCRSVDLDDLGLIATDMGFQTSMPGVFAAGDVRSGSTKQLASAVGEGAGAAIAIRQYLENKDRS